MDLGGFQADLGGFQAVLDGLEGRRALLPPLAALTQRAWYFLQFSVFKHGYKH